MSMPNLPISSRDARREKEGRKVKGKVVRVIYSLPPIFGRKGECKRKEPCVELPHVSRRGASRRACAASLFLWREGGEKWEEKGESDDARSDLFPFSREKGEEAKRGKGGRKKSSPSRNGVAVPFLSIPIVGERDLIKLFLADASRRKKKGRGSKKELGGSISIYGTQKKEKKKSAEGSLFS